CAGCAAGGAQDWGIPRPHGRDRSPSQPAVTKTLRTQLLIALMCAALLVYFVLIGRDAVALIGSGRAAAVGLGLALLVMPFIGLGAMIATLRAGFAHQKLARLIADDGMELDTSALPRRASGRF